MEKDIQNKDIEAMADEEMLDNVVVITDEEGNEFYYVEEMVIPVGDKNFAILVGINEDEYGCEDEACHCHEHDDDEEENVIIARIDFDENGEPVYLGPTDEEFEAVKAEYEKLAESWDEE